jgi:hypothetical protein
VSTATKPRPFRLTAPAVPEQDLHEQVARILDLELAPPVAWTTFPAGSVPLPPAYAAKLTRMGLKPGWPDILVLHGRLFGIELKRHGGGLSQTRTVRTRLGRLRLVEGQADVFPRLAAAGMTIGIARSVEEVLCLLDSWNVPRARRVRTAA